ncbi:hypothetical protein N7465_011896 [Penicillium sp. CMV-2018d]|nr:hypothetical protein N7465_011896 [Penicillium sp. CMV-2018d]
MPPALQRSQLLDAWKGQVIAVACGLGALALMLGTVIWLAWFHALQARLKDPQRVITGEYLEEKKEMKKGKTPWWQFWAKKECLSSRRCRRHQQEQDRPRGPLRPCRPRHGEAGEVLPPRLTVLCDELSGESPSSGEAHVQRPESRARIEFTAPRGLRLPPHLDVDSDVLSIIRNALKGKGRV